MNLRVEDSVRGRLFRVLVASAVLAGGCDAAAPGESDEDIDGIDIDAPADSIAQGRIWLTGTIAIGELSGDIVSERGRGRGFTIDLRRGDELTVEVGASKVGRFRVYGPKLASGKWGGAQMNKKVFKAGGGHDHAVLESFDVEAPAHGKYAFVFVALREGATLFDFKIKAKGLLGGCNFGGNRLTVGGSIPAGDGCNYCICLDEGRMSCSELSCGSTPGCMLNGRRLNRDERAPIGDGCNTCSCNEGGVLYCTQLACAPESGCVHNGRRLRVGGVVPAGDGCNTCACREDGYLACTELACAPTATCNFGGDRHSVGETFPARDSCNSCTCREGGSVSCTELTCHP